MKITPIAMEAIGVFCYIKRSTRQTIYTLLWQYIVVLICPRCAIYTAVFENPSFRQKNISAVNAACHLLLSRYARVKTVKREISLFSPQVNARVRARFSCTRARVRRGIFDKILKACYAMSTISARITTKYPIRDARGTSPMTARQPPGEKGGNACTIGLYRPHKSRLVFLRLFFGRV